MNITVIGTVFVDIKGYPFSDFIPDGRNPGFMKYVHGGVARNAAEDLARIGLSTRLVALTDHSPLAADVRARLTDSGVDTRFVQASDNGMGTWMAVFNDQGDVAASISIRPELSPLTPLLETHHQEIFEATDGILLEIDLDEETVEKVFYYAAKYGKKVYAAVSVMRIALERRRFFPRTECFICNLQEAGMLTGEDLSDLPVRILKQRIAEAALEEGFSRLIVTLREQGAVFADCTSGTSVVYGHCPAWPVTLVDSTGAGDAFCAGASAALISGKDPAEACRAGNALAAKVITSTENVCPKGTQIF